MGKRDMIKGRNKVLVIIFTILIINIWIIFNESTLFFKKNKIKKDRMGKIRNSGDGKMKIGIPIQVTIDNFDDMHSLITEMLG